MALRALVTRKALTGGVGLGFQIIRGMQTVSSSLPDLPYDYGALEPVISAEIMKLHPDLPYDYGALEPVISAEIMKLHHQKHHRAYVTNYNQALEQLLSVRDKGDAPTIVRLQNAIKFNGGGHINHSIFWKNLAPVHEGGGEPPKGSLGWAIDAHFGSLDSLILKMNAEGAALQGSGWVWLGLDKDFNRLVVETTENQDPLVSKGANLVPLLGIDVWEHAYYLQYKNERTDYLKSIWNVMNWKYANEVYETECH